MLQNPKLKELSFLVYGLGLSGRSVIKFFKKNKIKKFKVWDDKKKNILKKFRSKNLTKTLNQVDYIVLSPGISLVENKNLSKYKKKIITDIDLFYLTNIKSKSIVVTGTNGKSTTCKLLAQLLQKNKFNFSSLTSRGHAQKTLGHTNEAIESYKSAYKIKPDHGEAFFSLANLKTYSFTDNEINIIKKEWPSSINLIEKRSFVGNNKSLFKVLNCKPNPIDINCISEIIRKII